METISVEKQFKTKIGANDQFTAIARVSISSECIEIEDDVGGRVILHHKEWLVIQDFINERLKLFVPQQPERKDNV